MRILVSLVQINQDPAQLLMPGSDFRLIKQKPGLALEMRMVTRDFIAIVIQHAQVNAIKHQHGRAEDSPAHEPGLEIRGTPDLERDDPTIGSPYIPRKTHFARLPCCMGPKHSEVDVRGAVIRKDTLQARQLIDVR